MIYRIYKKEIVLPVLSVILILILTGAIWNKLVKSHKDWVRENLAQTGKLASQEFNLVLKQSIESIENLKTRLEYTDGKNFKYWKDDAQLLLEQHPSIHFVEWINSNMVIKSIVPLIGNKSVLGLDISKIVYRKKEWVEHSFDDSTNITPWANMIQGGQAFLIDVPVYFQNRFRGTITAGMDFMENLIKITESLDGYPIEVRDNDGAVFYKSNTRDIDKKTDDLVYEEKILIDKLHGKYWSIRMYPSKSSFSPNRLHLINYFLITGIIFALLSGFLVYFYLKSEKLAKRATGFNNTL
ncbi:hypothetical protein [Changchengzhania lutea]|uniref:hypothetical protein n=1 Tax=Changchengzhania lutea TaxID=2049305 RepID=UPI00115DFBD9|nr:hypothetical protein [Changchengzhania lutea]